MNFFDADNLQSADLAELEQLGMRFWLNDGKLRFEAPPGLVSDTMRQWLSARKQDIMQQLQQRSMDESDPFPLTSMQQAYWVGQTAGLPLSTQARFYVELECDVSASAHLEAAVQILIQKHGMLRAVIGKDDQQRVLADVPYYPVKIHRDEADEQTLLARRQAICAREWDGHLWPQFDIQASCRGQRMSLHMHFALWVLDGVSIQTLITQLLGLCANPAALPPDCAMSYARYAETHADVQLEPDYQQALEWWRARLPEFPAAPALPLAAGAEQIRRPQFKRLSASLSAVQAHALQAFARTHDLSQNFALCAAYAEVLAYFSGSRHFALTLLYSDRDDHMPQARNVLGNFSRTLLLEVAGDEQDSFASRAQILQQRFWSDLEYASLSGIEVGRELNRVRGSAAAGNFPVTFTAVPALLGGVRENPLQATLSHQDCHLQVPQVHLDHQVYEAGDGGLVLNWDYVQGLYPDGLIERMFGAYCDLLGALAQDEALWRQAQLPFVNAAPLAVPGSILQNAEQRLHLDFERIALQEPLRSAVITGQHEFSYGELRARALALAAELLQAGVTSGDLVAVVMNKGWEQVLAVFGILYAGAAYVPVDAAFPQERQLMLLQESGARIVLTQSGLQAQQAWPAGVLSLAVDQIAPMPNPPQQMQLARQGIQDLAYVIFTSGSTGKPKGVAIDHRGAWNTVNDINQRCALQPQDRVFGISSLSFDLSVYDIFGPLSCGAALVLPDVAHVRDAWHWVEMAQRHQVSIWNSVPALAQLLEEAAHLAQADLARLRVIMMSGDWIPLSLPGRLRQRFTAARLISMGGATEASIWSIWHEIDHVDPAWRSIPYGVALRHQSMHVLDRNLQECPHWVTGEIHIGGIGLAQGYWQDEARSATAFIRHPQNGMRLYKTGDLGRRHPDGVIEFLGRRDFQVKIQGYRIECSEIESVLLEHAALNACVVSVAGDAKGVKRLIAYLVAQPGNTQDQAALELELLQLARKRLPAYMIPSHQIWLDSLPLSANGKLERKRLPAPDFAQAAAATPVEAMQDSLEQSLQEIWQELLDAPVSGRRQNFFELGGSSFSGMRLMAKLRERFGVQLGLGDLLQAPDIASLAQLLRQPQKAEHDPALVLLRQGATAARPLFCVHPVGGNVACYRELAQALDAERSVYGLQSPALSGAEALPQSIAEMAARYLHSVRRVQPQGPYQLGGWSLGGAVAYEMARQLRAAGEQVDLVFMIDTWLPRCIRSGQDETSLLSAFVQDISAISGQRLTEEACAWRACSGAELWQAAQECLLQVGIDLGGVEGLQRLFQVFRANLLALDAYAPAACDAPVLLLHAQELGRSNAALQQNWPGLALTLQAMPGDHYSILQRPNMQRLAAQLAGSLSE